MKLFNFKYIGENSSYFYFTSENDNLNGYSEYIWSDGTISKMYFINDKLIGFELCANNPENSYHI